MPYFIELQYYCGCKVIGNPDFRCKKHDSGISHISEKIQIINCKICYKPLKLGDDFTYKCKKGLDSLKAYHVGCILRKLGYYLGLEGKPVK